MDKINDGGPAFPLAGDGDNRKTERGMSLRTYLAGLAMQGMASRHWSATEVEAIMAKTGVRLCESVATTSVNYADALIAALNERGA